MIKLLKRFADWYNRDDSVMMPTPSNKIGFWAILSIIIAAMVKIYAEINNL
ncbi:hypothetical protein [Flavobacterium sp.]|jgi:hypothetical protein|uniref:hypothetical protein n=1 Tax=Flavobacterium sp. TaxID=239 RepID=UPI0037BF1F06